MYEKSFFLTLALNSEKRLYEEDPYTHRWTRIAPWRIVVHSSRFEVDMNRSRDKAVYRDPADAWGLTVWNEPPSDDAVEESLVKYDHFYSSVELFIAGLLKRFERLVVSRSPLLQLSPFGTCRGRSRPRSESRYQCGDGLDGPAAVGSRSRPLHFRYVRRGFSRQEAGCTGKCKIPGRLFLPATPRNVSRQGVLSRGRGEEVFYE